MTRKLKKAVRTWLEEEHSGALEPSEKALQTVFSLLPEEPVPLGFADRLLARARLQPRPMPQASWATYWGLRAAVSLCLVMVALFLLVIPDYVPAMLGIFNLGRATDVAVGALVAVFHQLGVGLVVWRTLSAGGSIVASTLSSPQYLAALFLAALLSIGAMRALHNVILSERSSRYVGSV